MSIKLSVKSKLFILFIVVIVVSVSAIGLYGFKSAKDSYINSALLINEGKARALSNEITGLLSTIPDDVLYNANHYALEKLLVWSDLKDKRKIKYWEGIYLSTLKDYILNKKSYYQARILDINGYEKFLLKYNEKLELVVETPLHDLQNKNYMNYFKQAISLKKGEYHISHMTLNTENKKIEKSYVPVVRYSTPIINKNGENKGVMVLNFNATILLKKIENKASKESLKDARKYYLLDENGYYLYNDDKKKRWGYQLKTDFNFKNDFKDIFRKFKDKEHMTFRKDEKIFAMNRIYPDKVNNPYRYWYLVTVVNEDVALKSLDEFVNIFFIILFSILFIGLLLIGLYISKLLDPLSKVTSKLKSLSKGEIKKDEIDYTKDDEIGYLVKSSSILVEAIETTIKQANLVANGNFSEDIKLLGKNDSLGMAIKEMTSRLKEIANLATGLSNGNYDVNIIPKNIDDKLGLALVDMIEYLKQITKVAESIANGEIDVKYTEQGEDDRLGIAISKMIEYLKTIQGQAESIVKEDFSKNIEIKSSKDELGKALASMSDILKENSEKTKNDIWFNNGISSFSDKLVGLDDKKEVSKQAISMACRYVDATGGVLYSFDNEDEVLLYESSFALNNVKYISSSYKLGESIIGQVAQEKEGLHLKNIEEDEIDVKTGTGYIKQKEIYACPLVYEEKLYGVIELMTLERFSKLHIEYIDKVSNILASILHSTHQNIRIKALLEESQKAYENLQIQSEELQETNMQMEEQQEQLEQQALEMKDKNNALTAAKEELDIRADELEKSNKYKSEFLANMSHELRTPLNSIILLSKLLSQNKNTFMNKEDVEKTVVINKAGNDLLLLINDILDLSKIEAGHMELNVTKFHSADIVKELKDLFYIVADEKNIEFIVNDEYDDILKLDKAKFLQILKNLLSNSFKFTSKGGVSVRIYKEKKNLILDIKDTGIGIKKDKLSIIFEEFKQADGSISREYGGTGLGLSICKKLIDLMDGEIKVKSESLKGSTFSIYIPLESRNDFSLSNEELKSEENNLETYEPHILADIDVDLKGNVLDGKNILIVDDDSRNIFALMSVVENFGAESYSAMNGDEAIKLLEANEVDIDIILMDIMMPIMDGIETIKLIKSKEKFKNIPIIAVTAKTMQKDKEMCFEAGANDYLAKPIEQNALISMLKVWSNN